MKIRKTTFIRVSLFLPYILCGVGYLFSRSEDFGSSNNLSDLLSQYGILWLALRFFYGYYFYWLPPYTFMILLWLLWSRKKPAYKMISAAVLLPFIFTPLMVLWMGLDLINLFKVSTNSTSEIAAGLVFGTGFIGLLVSPIILIFGYLFIALASIIFYLLKMVNLIDNEE